MKNYQKNLLFTGVTVFIFIVLALLLSWFVSTFNPENYYVEMDGHSTIITYVILGLPTITIAFAPFYFIVNYHKYPWGILLFPLLYSVLTTYAGGERAAIINIPNLITAIILYNYFSINKLSKNKYVFLFQELFYAFAYLYSFMMLLMMLTEDNFHNGVKNNRQIEDIVGWSFVLIAIVHVFLVVYNFVKKKAVNKYCEEATPCYLALLLIFQI